MQALAVTALGGQHPRLAEPVEVTGRHPPCLLDPVAETLALEAALAREEPLAELQVPRLDPMLARDLGKPQRVCRRRVDRDRRPHRTPQLEQAERVADAVGRDARACALEPESVDDAADIKA